MPKPEGKYPTQARVREEKGMESHHEAWTISICVVAVSILIGCLKGCINDHEERLEAFRNGYKQIQTVSPTEYRVDTVWVK